MSLKNIFNAFFVSLALNPLISFAPYLAAEVNELGRADLSPKARVYSGILTSGSDEYYSFFLESTNLVELELLGLRRNANLLLADAEKNLLQRSTNPGTSNELIRAQLEPGNYYLVVRPVQSGVTPYDVTIKANFITDDTVVSDPRFSFLDPEFDQVSNRVSWQDDQGNLWVAPVDPSTGDFLLKQVKLVDRGLPPIVSNSSSETGVGNGPEWAYGSRGSQMVYTKNINGTWVLHRAFFDGSYWQTEILSDGAGGFAPLGSNDENDLAPRIIYRLGSPLPAGQRIARREETAWREISNPFQGSILPDANSSASWIPGERALVYTKFINDISQAIRFDIDSREAIQLTSGTTQIQGVRFWNAPEFDNEQLFLATENFSPTLEDRELARQIGIFRKVSGEWMKIKTVRPPTNLPFIRFVRDFVYDGQSYIYMLAVRDNRSRAGAEIWIAGINPEFDFYRRVNNPNVVAQPSDPELYIGDSEAFMYYTDNLNSVTYRVRTGL